MTDPTAAPSYRLKLPCADEAEFRDKFLQKYVARGVFVPSERPKPVGTRLKLKLEIKGGVVLVSGDGMVTSVTQPGGTTKAGMTVRLTALHADSIQFSLSPGGSAAQAAAAKTATSAPPPVPAAPPRLPSLTPAPPPLVPATRAPATTPVPPPPPPAPPPSPVDRPDFFDLTDDDLTDGPHAAAAPDEGVMAITDPAFPVPSELVETKLIGPLGATPEPTPPPASIPVVAPAGAGRKRPGLDRRVVIVIAAAAAVLVVATVGGLLSSRGTKASRTQALRVEEQLRLADLRLLEGRLAGAGGDSALDHLLEAKGAAPDDARVMSRLKLLADKFEQLGDRALARKNLREAAVHFKAALAADPSRAKVRASLEDIEQPDPPAR